MSFDITPNPSQQPAAGEHSDRPDLEMGLLPGGSAPQRRRRMPRPVLAGAAAFAGVAVIAGTAVGVQRFAAGASDDAVELMPGNSFAYASVNLDPSLGQKVSAVKLAKLLNDNDNGNADKVDTDPIKVVCDNLFKGLDCAKEVKPWLGSQFAVAAWPGSSASDVRGVLAIKTKDKDAALAAAKKAEHGTAVVNDGYLLLDADKKHPSVAGLQEQVSAHGTLAKNAQFTGDVQRLDIDGIATMWVDLGQLKKVSPTSLGSADGTLAPELPTAAAMNDLQGRFVARVSLQDSGLRLKAVTVDASAKVMDSLSGPKPRLGDLPADSVVALSVQGLGKAFEQLSAAGMNEGMPPAKAFGDALAVGVWFNGSSPNGVAFLSGAELAQTQSLLSAYTADPHGSGDLPKATQDGDAVKVTLGASGAGKLVDDPAFKAAVPGYQDADMVAYVNLAKLSAQVPDVKAKDAGVVGFSAKADQAQRTATMDLIWNLAG